MGGGSYNSDVQADVVIHCLPMFQSIHMGFICTFKQSGQST